MAHVDRRAGPRMTTGDDYPPLYQRLAELKMPLLMLFGLQDNRGSVGERARRFRDMDLESQRPLYLIQWDQPQRFHELSIKFFA